MPLIANPIVMDFMERSLDRVGVPANEAREIAEVILDSELRGKPDHGLYFFRFMITWLQDGTMNPKPTTRITKNSALSTTVDSDNGCGVIGMNIATEMSIAKAKQIGMSAAAVTNSANVITLGPFVQRAAEEGLIAFSCSAFRHPLIPPTNGLTGKFGTNPIAYAFPAGRHVPFVLDMATSGIAAAKVWEAATNGESIPAGFVEYPDGSPLTEAVDYKLGASLILPMSGVKGYGLAMMADLFANVLAGNDWGHFLWLINPEEFQPMNEYLDTMDGELDRIKTAKKKPGVDEIFYPGERGQRKMAELLEKGAVPLGETAWNAMQSIADELSVQMPVPIELPG